MRSTYIFEIEDPFPLDLCTKKLPDLTNNNSTKISSAASSSSKAIWSPASSCEEENEQKNSLHCQSCQRSFSSPTKLEVHLRKVHTSATHPQLHSPKSSSRKERIFKVRTYYYIEHEFQEKKISKSDLDTTFWIFPHSQDAPKYPSIHTMQMQGQTREIYSKICVHLGRISCHDFPLPPPIKQPLHSHSSSVFLRARVFIICQWHATIFPTEALCMKKQWFPRFLWFFFCKFSFTTQNTGTIVKYIAL